MSNISVSGEETFYVNPIASTGIINLGYNSTADINICANSELIKTIELPGSIELVYKQQSMLANNFGPLPSRVYKIVFSCVDGKWHKSEPIFGQIVPAQQEYYDFG